MSLENRIIFVACAAAGVAAALMPGSFRLDAWLFGVALGILQSLIGIRLYRIALARRAPAFGFAIGSGVVRIAGLLAALAVILSTGEAPAPFVWSILIVYVIMMTAEIILVARWTGAFEEEAR